MGNRNTGNPGKAGIEIKEDPEPKPPENLCPVCGEPSGKERCDKCGWRVEDLGRDYSDVRDPTLTLMNAKLTYSAMKRENIEMARTTGRLLENNERLTELVLILEEKMKRLRDKSIELAQNPKKFFYEYEKGGWREIQESDKNKLEMKTDGITVEDINRQLEEIMRLIRVHKKNLNSE